MDDLLDPALEPDLEPEMEFRLDENAAESRRLCNSPVDEA